MVSLSTDPLDPETMNGRLLIAGLEMLISGEPRNDPPGGGCQKHPFSRLGLDGSGNPHFGVKNPEIRAVPGI